MISFIQEFAILFLVIVGLSLIVKFLRQPIIIAYVIAGFSFSFLFIKEGFDTEQIIILSELGIIFMLFLMGLEFDLKSLKFIGKDIFLTTIYQSAIFFALAYLFAIPFGFSNIERVYLAILFMFSSTLFVAKWLEDKHETSTLHGKIVLSTLIIQDIFAIVTITILGIAKEPSFSKFLFIPLQGVVLILIAYVLARFALNHVLKFSSKYPELLFVLSLGICFLFVYIAPFLGYPTTIGAFIGGITLANTIYKHDISSRLRPLIVFFNMLFFVSLGIQIHLDISISHIIFVALLSLLSLTLKPLVIYATLRLRGYDMKTSFVSGLQLGQISEFGIIIMLGGLATGAIDQRMSLISIISVIFTMIASSYFIKYDKKIFIYCQHILQRYNEYFSAAEKKVEQPAAFDYNIIFFGYHDIGRELYEKIEGLGKKIAIIENDPETMDKLRREGRKFIYNSAANPEFFKAIDFEKVELVISSLIDSYENKMIIRHLKKANPKAIAIVTAKNLKESMALYRESADYVICPTYLNEQHVSVLLEDYTKGIHQILNKKISELTKLAEKEEKKGVHKEDDLIWDINSLLKAQRHTNIESEHLNKPQ
ncbi:MAG TPA: cation:proton antiporter [Candidatus Nanoarchaeia archaeon]|nr:cation:proton antiporter [Candidatus Nanoarchaeia archaeon]